MILDNSRPVGQERALSAKLHERPRGPPLETSGFERLLAAEVALEAELALAEREAEELVRAADQAACEYARSLGAAVDDATGHLVERLEAEAAGERARIEDQTAR